MDAGFTAPQQRSKQTAMAFHPALSLAELPADAKSVATVAGLEVLLINDGGTIHALENRCSHADSPLDCGRVRLGWIACPAHGARFDLETGEALTGPATEPVRVFAARVVDGMIEVEV
jgi:3-phenylpropionate/trans-cinnamate dioxygenase ferredoxin subunit